MHTNFSIIILYLYVVSSLAVNNEKNESIFIPTHEWQPVKKGTPIPQGLHIRHNFQTGLTEAKLMNSDEDVKDKSEEYLEDSRSKSLTIHPDELLHHPDVGISQRITKQLKQVKILEKELKTKLKLLREQAKLSRKEFRTKQKFRLNEAGIPLDLNEEESRITSGKRLKSYATLKNEFKDLIVNVSNDAELMAVFIEQFDKHKDSIVTGKLTTSEIENILSILNNLEYLLHQIDNAQVFTEMKGMTKIVCPCLNATNDKVKAEALRLLGAAVQSNPKVQAKALESDFIQKLLYIMTTNNKTEMRTRCLFALGALIRQFPAAQKTLINHGGLEIFGEILDGNELQTQTRVIKLISDLIVERQDLAEAYNDEQRNNRMREYGDTDFEQKLILHEYCEHLRDLLIKSVRREITDEFSMEDHQFLETIYESMITVSRICNNEFKKYKIVFITAMNDIMTFYYNLDTNLYPDKDDLFKGLILLMNKLLNVNFDISHDEL